MTLPDEDRAAVLEEMEYVREHGTSVARHLRQDIYEVRAIYNTKAYRILFAGEGRFHHILLALDAFQKKTQHTPQAHLKLAEQRLADWRRRGKVKRAGRENERRAWMQQDFLDEMIEESTRRNSEFPSLMEEARQRRQLLEALAAIRSRSRISQSAIAKRIKTSQSAIARLEAGIVDPRLSTVQRYAASVGKRIQWTLVDA
jgi:phage-related protein/DNA-binding XRE family transcriptional regulator